MPVRDETGKDRQAVFDVHAAAFPSPAEARLVDRLRDDGDLAISLVAQEDGAIVGHVAFSRMRAPFRALGLAPIGVLPSLQGRGCGSALVRAGLERARNEDWDGVFVLGDAAYYERFGFRQALASGFSCRYAGEHFMALAMRGDGLPQLLGEVAYARAFDALG